jgi:uncharacterized repeat protein (TIGR01451 family)
VTDHGDNLDSDGTCDLTLASDHPGVDPQLSALAANGGPTPTMAISSTSPALNAIPFGEIGCGSTTTTDQRGVVRPFGQTGCEIGAYERGDVALRKFVADPTSVKSGKKVTYTGTVLNGGATDATGVVVTDKLPGKLSFVSAQSSIGSCAFHASTLTCTLGLLPAAGTATFKIIAKVTAPAGKSVSDKATVSATNGDTLPGNDTVTAKIMVT